MILHLREERIGACSVTAIEARLDRGAEDAATRSGGSSVLGLAAGWPVAHPCVGPRGSGCGVAQSIHQVGIIVMVRGFLGQDRDTVLRDAALPRQTLLGHVAGHAIARELHLSVEHVTQTLALIVVGQTIEQVIAE